MWGRLLDSAASDPEQIRRGRWLSRLFLSFIALNSLLIILTLFTGPSPFLLTDFGIDALLVVLYWLNRFGRVTLAAGALVVGLSAAIIAPVWFLRANLALALIHPVLLIPVIAVAGVFLSWRAVPLIVLSFIGFTLWYYYGDLSPALVAYRQTDITAVATLGTAVPMLFAAAGALSWLSNRLIGEALSDLRRRNGELETAYAELAVQSQREHTLGANIGNLAGQLSAVSARQASGVTTQAQSISQVVRVVAELHAAADQIAARAEEVRLAADLAMRSVQRGQDLVLHSRAAVQRNRAQVQMVIERMHTLGELSTRLTRFVNRIHGLSDETHLLALNATIEAAGAGPLGRRFGVVAVEVQNLSKRSNEIVDQIRTLIEELQQAGEVTLAATQSSIAVADEVEHLADEVRTAQEQVGDAVQRTTELVHLISVATGQQTSATAQMTQTMSEIAQVAAATNHDTSALERAVAELIRAADMLNSAMTRVRIHPLI